MRIHFLIFTTSLLAGFGCGSDDSSAVILPPSNLKVRVEKSQIAEGQVVVTATADNANYFELDLGDGAGFERNDAGNITHTYNESGDYTILVRAHTTPAVYIETSATVNIEIDNSAQYPEGYSTPEMYDEYTLVWQDEFDGNSLSSDWKYEVGTGGDGWGNNELQYYKQDNTSVQDGYLIIEAREESFEGQSYTSSRLITEGKQSFKYGRIDIRAVLPKTQGLWPALWMLGSNFPTIGWPKSGEIDIMEMVGGPRRDNTVFGTLHWDNNGSPACTCGQGSGYTLTQGTFADEFHVFTLIWDELTIKWYVDDQLHKTVDITPADLDEFQKEFFFIFNVAVGGNLPGSPNETTVFPQQMIVDYVRVFQ